MRLQKFLPPVTVISGSIIALFISAQPSLAGTITLQGVTSNTCQFSQLNAEVDGSLTVICTSGAPSNAAPVLQFRTVTYSVAESAGSVTVYVDRSGSTADVVTVNYTTADVTALAASDYTAASGTLTFLAGEATKTIVIPILDDATEELAEAFTVTLSTPGGASLGTNAQATVTILANDSVTVTPPPSGSCPTPVAGTLTYDLGVNDNYATSNIQQIFTNPGMSLDSKVIANTTKAYAFTNTVPYTVGTITVVAGNMGTNRKDVVISECPGQFTSTNVACMSLNRLSGGIAWSRDASSTACQIAQNKTYYFNIRPSVAGQIAGYAISSQ